MNRPGTWFVVLLSAVVALLVQLSALQRVGPPTIPATPMQVRRVLFREIQPIKLANCDLQRFGEQYDGGYLLCGNLLGAVRSAYSYGISGYDGWGCEVSTTLGVRVHQYDCFDLTRPVCKGGRTTFHGECIGTEAGIQDGRPFGTLAGQIAKNRDRGKHLVVKMDVEGAEWDSFITAPSEVLQRIDQLVVEFHGTDEARFVVAMRRLKQFFHVAHLHWNNFSCVDNLYPFPAWAYEVLLVNRRLAVPAGSGGALVPHPFDAPNSPDLPECGSHTRK